MRFIATALLGSGLVLGCASGKSSDGGSSTATGAAPATATTGTSAAGSMPTSSAGAAGTDHKKEAAARIPQGSGDYSELLAEAMAYKAKRIDFAELERRLLARRLPPHRLGDAYLLMSPPPPPPGTTFDPMMMPKDWEGTWGEVAMTMFAGDITKEEYERLHKAAHPDCANK